jgi:hypothetical protein
MCGAPAASTHAAPEDGERLRRLRACVRKATTGAPREASVVAPVCAAHAPTTVRLTCIAYNDVFEKVPACIARPRVEREAGEGAAPNDPPRHLRQLHPCSTHA